MICLLFRQRRVGEFGIVDRVDGVDRVDRVDRVDGVDKLTG
jgi:hypothetical protein